MKKFISKIIIVCTAILFIGLYTGCSLLDQEPQGEWTIDDSPGGSFQTEVFSLYARLRGYNVTAGLPALAIHNFRSEDVEKGSLSGDAAHLTTMFENFEYIASNSEIQGYWTSNYEIIHSTNRVLSDISDVTNPAEGVLINKGEAHFFRAFAYFNLVRAFGEVPLIDFKVEDAAEANIPKSTAAQIYQLIDADLIEATKLLPQTWESRFVGRLTWGAARSLHARTYMMRNDWANMYAAANEVVTSGLYNLNTPFDRIFRETGENSSESVFEIQATATASLPASDDIGSPFARTQGVRGSGEWNLGWGFHTPTTILANAFEAGDPRKDETLLYFVRTGQDPMSIPANRPWNERPIAMAEVTNAYYNKKAYTNPALRAQFNREGFWMNIRMIRFSDVVLMAAESANELGNTTVARDLLEQVRARARGTNTAVLPFRDTTDQAALRDFIRHERRIELAMEWDRFYDLVRWGTARQVLHAVGKTGFQDRHALLPLPQAEIDKSNGVLVQNPNY
ncbi:MAG: RagB/SusD family nutrient uptake outer membrane protein [Dysgonamonadaceae bacterium]|jgi:hypothetical protein|nr:RagB/SusD family nutrient uptake outer membrane protein [Dysgonamonadaceae bacterium]